MKSMLLVVPWWMKVVRLLSNPHQRIFNLVLTLLVITLPQVVGAQVIAGSSSNSNTVNMSVVIGSTFTLDPTKGYSYARNNNYVSSVSDENAFTITSKFKDSSSLSSGTKLYRYTFDVTALKIGVYTIVCDFTATNWSGTSFSQEIKTYVITVTEEPTVKSITMPTSLQLNVGESYTINPVIVDDGAKTKLTWNSSVPSVATVNSDGVVTANAIGSSIITCTASNGVKAQCTVVVSGIIATDIEITPNELEILINSNVQLSAVFTPSNTTNQRVIWSSSDNSVALVTSDGMLVGINEGYCNVSATTTDGSDLTAMSIVHVIPPFVGIESINFKSETISLVMGEEIVLEPTIEPLNASVKTLNWISDNPDIVNVDNTGKITACNIGKAYITAQTTDGSDQHTTCTVVVKSIDKSAYDNVIYIEDQTTTPGSDIQMYVYMDNVEPITAAQFDIQLPNVVSFIYDGISICDEDGRLDQNSHQLTVSQIDDNTIRVICHSSANTVISGNSGKIITFKIMVAEDAPSDIYDIILKNIVLSSNNGNKYDIAAIGDNIKVISAMPGDADGDGVIDVADIVMVVNYIMSKPNLSIILDAADYDGDGVVDVADIVGIVNYIMHGKPVSKKLNKVKRMAVSSQSNCRLDVEPLTIRSGLTSKTVTLDMYNPGMEFTAIECDVVFPSGVSIATKRNGSPNVQMNTQSDRNDGTHTVSCVDKGEGIYHIACYSNQNDIFYDEEGAIIDIALSISPDINAGCYEISVENVKLVEVNGNKTMPGNATSSLLVDDGGAGPNITLYGHYSNMLIAEFSDALKNNPNICSINLCQADGFEYADKIKTSNPNTLYYVLDSNWFEDTKNVVVCSDNDRIGGLVEITDGYAFNAPLDFNVDKISYIRDFTTDSWQALYLPCSIHYDIWSLFGSVAELTGVEGTAESPVLVWDKKTSGDLEPNTTYIFKPNNADQMLLSDLNVDIAVSPEEGEIGSSFVCGGNTYDICGNFLPKKDMYSSHSYALYNGNFHPASSDEVILKPMRVFIKTSSLLHQPNKIMMRINDEYTSSIEDCIYEETIPSDYINMSGMHISHPTNGVYIANGKKIYINK